MKLFLNILISSLSLFFISCGDNTTTPLKDVTSLSIDESNITMHSTDATLPITSTVTFSDGSTADATTSTVWSSSQSDVVEVSQGELTPGINNGGEATITASYDHFEKSFDVNVTSLTDFNASFQDINTTGTYIFQAYGNFDNGDTDIAIINNIVWSADNGAEIEVTDDGVTSITLYSGDTNVTATVFEDTNTSSPIGPQSKIYTIN